jgi:hypothetical protein
MRFPISAVVLILLSTAPAFAGEEGLKGHWKFSIYEGTQQISFWLLHLDTNKDGKLAVSADPMRGAPKVKVDDVKFVGDTFQMKLRATVRTQLGPEEVQFEFEGRLPKPGAKKILGSLSQEGSTVPAVLEATTAKTVFELDRELVTRTPTDPKSLTAIFDLIKEAKENKVAAKEMQEWVDSSLKAADQYGPRFQLLHNRRLLDSLLPQKDYTAVAAETARRISKQIDPKAPADTQLQMLSAISDALRKADAKDEVKALEARLEKLEETAFTEYAKTSLNFKVEKFAGRKAKSNRAVVVELFTGAQCPPCVAADLAFEGLEKSYPNTDVVLLQYHMHIPRPEPMSNADAEARFEYYAESYAKQIRGTPAILFNGKPDAPGGGSKEDAPDKFKEYTSVVNKLLESPATVQLVAKAVRSGSKIDIAAKVQDLEKPGDKIRLRLVLVEDWVRFRGTNGLAYHHRVVRAMPGGAKGATLKAKDFDHVAEVDLDKLRVNLGKYLDQDYPEGSRPMRMRDLRVVAFVQNDDTAEILQAVEVPVTEKK